RAVFATLGAQDYALFTALGELLSTQLRTRSKMAKAGVKPASAVPGRGDVETWFKSMKAASNPDVRQAYTTYANSFFYHRITDNLQELAGLTLDQIFSRDVSITGVRGIVCTGYALLGATLLGLAGGQTQGFIMAVRATDDQIRNNKIDAGHALARV